MNSSSTQKVLCVLYPDPLTGFPPNYSREAIPALTHYPDGQTMPTPSSLDFTRGPRIDEPSPWLVLNSR